MENLIKYLQIFIVKIAFPRFWMVPTKLILAQAIHETGRFTSAIYQENKNIFGMKQPSVRKTTAIGSNRGHAVYTTVWHSIWDYFLRQKYFKVKASSPNIYVESTFSSGYAEDKSYKEKWLQIYHENNFPALLAALVVFSLLSYVIILILKKWLNIDVLRTLRSKLPKIK